MASPEDRITAAHLMAMRLDARAAESIAHFLNIGEMPANLARRTKREIAIFVSTGDATLAAQLIHAAQLRRKRRHPSPKPGELAAPEPLRMSE